MILVAARSVFSLFSPDEVRDRIHAIMLPNKNRQGEPGLLVFNESTGFIDKDAKPKTLDVVKVRDAYPMRGQVGDKEHGLFVWHRVSRDAMSNHWE